jgi:hypothetical protein
MADHPPAFASVSMTGSIAANLHEGSRSEYLAQFVFSSFGTAIPVPHQEDSGLDIYCTLLERDGQRAWPRAAAGRLGLRMRSGMASARKADAPLPPGIMLGLMIRRMFAVIGR